MTYIITSEDDGSYNDELGAHVYLCDFTVRRHL